MEGINNSAKIYGIFLLSVLATQAISSDNNYLPPHPDGMLILNLLQRPSPPVLSMSSIPFQEGMVNREFRLHLKPFVEATVPEFSYRFINGFYDMHGARHSIGTYVGVNVLPSGVTQTNYRAGDCFPQIRLGPAQGCNLHFYVDTKTYNTAEGNTGPVISMDLTWNWGSHNYIISENRLTGPRVSERLMDIIPQALLPIQGVVSPESQDGLRYDKESFSIIGKPNRTGLYHFNVSATNGKSVTESRELRINVSINPKDKPVFKTNYSLVSALPGDAYRVNLMELLELNQGFEISNQIHFSILNKKSYPDWLSIDKNAPTYLQATVPPGAAGQTVEFNLIATSNTGGESEMVTVFLPIAYDAANKPSFDKDIQLLGIAGSILFHDFRADINNPSGDEQLKVIIDKIEPQIPHLKVSLINSLEISAEIPEEAVGQTYFITLHANTRLGGNSDLKIIPLIIEIDKEKTPILTPNIQMPFLYPGQPFEYDFQAHHDIVPEYSDIPYTVRFAEGRYKPKWLRIENNKLIADLVPADLRKPQKVYIKIKNIPGGVSKELLLILHPDIRATTVRKWL